MDIEERIRQRLKMDQSKKLKACLNHSFSLADDLRKCSLHHSEDRLKLDSCETNSRMQLNQNSELKKDSKLSCNERNIALSVKDIMKKIENKIKQKQQFKSDWLDLHMDMKKLYDSIQVLPVQKKKRISKKK